MTGMDPRELRDLAALLRSGLTLRQAIVRWRHETDNGEIAEIARRVELGLPVTSALSGTAAAPMLATAFSLHLSNGIDLARWLDDAARRLEEEGAANHSARAASAGAVLSGRMVAALPLLFVPMLPISRSGFADPAGISLLLLGIGLAAAGLRWIGRLVPSPPTGDAVTELCGATAALLDAGLSLHAAIEAVAAGLEIDGVDPARLVRLGGSWPSALAHADTAFEPVRITIEQARMHGLPLAGALRALAERRRAEALREFEARLKRAPVLMVVPLTCCVLPAYGLLGVAPFLRSMSLG